MASPHQRDENRPKVVSPIDENPNTPLLLTSTTSEDGLGFDTILIFQNRRVFNNTSTSSIQQTMTVLTTEDFACFVG